MFNDDTIVAIATPPGSGGIGVIRLSGPDSKKAVLEIFRDISGNELVDLSVRKAVYGEILDSETGHVLDQCVVTYFKQNASYTGEEVVEVSCHGSRPILRRLVRTLSKGRVRPSGPGEFTFRALQNNRLDLTQAEAVNRLISADTLIQAEQAVQELQGSVQKRVINIENRLYEVVSMMEAEVDFAEEEESFSLNNQVNKKLNDLSDELADFIKGFSKAKLLREGATVVLAGRSNVGKSTLFNSILQRERSIVDSEPGTTRDYIAEKIELAGLPVTLIDTAGLRQGGERIEIVGMKRTEEVILAADLVLLVKSVSEELSAEDKNILEKIAEADINYKIVQNKIDKTSEEYQNDDKQIFISAKDNIGIGKLIESAKEELGLLDLQAEKQIVTEERQQNLFKDVAENVYRAAEAHNAEQYDEVVLAELSFAMSALNQITGKEGREEVYDRIFSNFCIGK